MQEVSFNLKKVITLSWNASSFWSRQEGKTSTKLSSITQNHSIRFPFLVAIVAILKILLSWAHNKDHGESAGDPQTSPQAHSFRLKEIKSILAKSSWNEKKLSTQS